MRFARVYDMKIGYLDHQEEDVVQVTVEFEARADLSYDGFEPAMDGIEVEIIRTDFPLSQQVVDRLIDLIKDDDDIADRLWAEGETDGL